MTCFKAKIRLYRKLDKDLIMLYRHPDFSLPNAIRQAVTMAARNEKGYIALPSAMRLTSYPKKIEFTADLYDEDVIAWFQAIPNGFRNDTLKNLVRGYLTGPVISPFIDRDGYDNTEFFNSSEKPIRQAPKHRTEHNFAEMQQFAEIQKILDSNGKTPGEILQLLKEGVKEEAKESLIEKTQPKTPPDPEETESPEPEIKNSDFDVFSAIDEMMS